LDVGFVDDGYFVAADGVGVFERVFGTAAGGFFSYEFNRLDYAVYDLS
jgi:hypothetical protein